MGSGAKGETMINMKKYAENCEYIRNKFGLSKGDSIYEIVNVITDAYRLLEDKPQMAEAKTEEETPCQSKAKRKKS